MVGETVKEIDDMTPEERLLLDGEMNRSLPIAEVMEQLTDLQKKYCHVMVLQKPKSKADALRRAGSKADAKYLSKMAWEMEQFPHVQAYMEHLRAGVVEQAGLDIHEIISNARRGIEMAFAAGKPKDADPHNRLLAEIGGFIKNTSPSSNTQTNIKIEAGNAIKGDSVEADFRRLKQIVGIKDSPIDISDD